MAIRTNTNPRAMDLQPEMRDILMRNGFKPISHLTVAATS